MAKGVVDRLECIEIKEHDPDYIAMAVCGRHGLTQLLVEHDAVREPGKGVVIGEVSDRLMGSGAAR